MRAAGAMTREVAMVPPELSLRRAWELMQERRVRHLPVFGHGALIGILSDRDVLLRSTVSVQGQISVPETPVGEAATPAPLRCHADALVSHVAQLMLERRIDALPVVNAQDKVIGLVTSSDLLALLVDSPKDERLPFRYHLRPEHESRSTAAA